MFAAQWPGQVCSLGYDVGDWLEAYTCHGPGDVQGEPVLLDTEWLAFLVAAYELDPVTGRRRIDRAVLSRPKGRAKSELAALIAVAEAFGPVRFDGWDADGQPIGRPLTSPLIKCLATEESQSGHTFQVAAFIVCEWGRDAHPGVYGGASGVRQYQSATSVYLPHGGEMAACTAGAASKDGGRETFVVADESHLYVTAELRSMYATVARNCGKRKIAEPWMMQTTTAHQKGQRSVAESVLTAWRTGKLPNADHWLVDHREATGPVNLQDRAHTLRQLSEVYGSAAAWMDLDRIYRTMLDPTECATPAVAARYFLNLPAEVDQTQTAIDPGRWSAAADPGQEQGTQRFYGLATASDRSWAALGCAWKRADGRVHLSLVKYAQTTSWVAAEVRRVGARRLLVDTASRGLVPTAQELSHTEQAQAHNALTDALVADQVRHDALPALDIAARNAMWKTAGDTRVLDRRGAADISPLIAVALAAHGLAAGARTTPKIVNLRAIVHGLDV